MDLSRTICPCWKLNMFLAVSWYIWGDFNIFECGACLWLLVGILGVVMPGHGGGVKDHMQAAAGHRAIKCSAHPLWVTEHGTLLTQNTAAAEIFMAKIKNYSKIQWNFQTLGLKSVTSWRLYSQEMAQINVIAAIDRGIKRQSSHCCAFLWANERQCCSLEKFYIAQLRWSSFLS